jgi:hypothetical protein
MAALAPAVTLSIAWPAKGTQNFPLQPRPLTVRPQALFLVTLQLRVQLPALVFPWGGSGPSATPTPSLREENGSQVFKEHMFFTGFLFPNSICLCSFQIVGRVGKIRETREQQFPQQL